MTFPKRLRLSLLLLAAVPLAFAAPGDIISADFERSFSPAQIDSFIVPLFAGVRAPDAEFRVDVYQVVYESTYPDGSPARIHAQFFLPDFTGQTSRKRALYLFGPGSTGLVDNCRPSREHEAGIHWGYYRAHVLSHAGQGSIGIIPDYMGFRDSAGFQYYLVAEAEAHALLDGIRAFSLLKAQLDYEGVSTQANFVAGFSQGGHAAFAAADYRTSYAPEIELAGVIGYGPSTDLAALMIQYPSVVPMMTYAFSQAFGSSFDPEQILLPVYADNLEDDVLTQCVGAMQSYYPHSAARLYQPRFYKALLDGELAVRYPELARHLAENSAGLSGHGVDVLILQGADDIVVDPATSAAFVARLRSLGSEVDYEFLEHARHDTRQLGFWQSLEWMQSKLSS